MLWQLSTGFAHEGTEPAKAAFSVGGESKNCVEPSANLAMDRTDGRRDVMSAVLEIVVNSARKGERAAEQALCSPSCQKLATNQLNAPNMEAPPLGKNQLVVMYIPS